MRVDRLLARVGRRHALPSDSALLRLTSGALLVSRSSATFCRVAPADVPGVERVLVGEAPLGALGRSLLHELSRHGFFGPPRPAEPRSPTVQVQLTNACNLACAYCCTNSGRPRTFELDLEATTRVVREARDLLGRGCPVALLGGEPLLVPWAIELGRRALHLGLRLTVFTNGTLLADPDVARRTAALIAEGAEVRVSLAGPTSESCDGASQAKRFDAALEGIRLLAGHGARVTIDLMLLPANVAATAERLPSLRRRLPEGTPVTLGLAYLSGRERGPGLFRSRAELEAALDGVALEAGERIPAERRGPLAFRRDGCGCALGDHLSVRSDGAVFSCFKMEEQVGDLAAGGLCAVLKTVREDPHPVSTLPLCGDCPLASLCGGGCRSENLLFTGNADTPFCGPWRVRVLSELLAEDRFGAVTWPVAHLCAEARARGIDAPAGAVPLLPSRHVVDT